MKKIDKDEIIRASIELSHFIEKMSDKSNIKKTRQYCRLKKSIQLNATREDCIQWLSGNDDDDYSDIEVDMLADRTIELLKMDKLPNWIENTGYMPACKKVVVRYKSEKYNRYNKYEIVETKNARWLLDGDDDDIGSYIILE